MSKPKQRTPKGAAAPETADPRFENFTTDPRYRLPSKKHTRTTVDKRFSRMLKDEDFTNTAKVDRYGRKLSSSGKKKALERLYVPDEEDAEVEDDDVVEKQLKLAGEGDDSAESDGSSEDEEDEEEGGVDLSAEEAFPDMQAEQADVALGEVSSRIAVVNMDWDNIRSVDLLAVFSGFANGGKVTKVSIYQSEFGKERMDREELEGPPREIFAQKEEEEKFSDMDTDSEDESEDDEATEEQIKKDLQKEDEGKDFDGAALRQYQLERLRYYYAVVECSSKETAYSIYQDTDGREYLSSANFFDLRFIPDGTEFDEKARDESESVPSDYHPIEFVTTALQHSKVKLTWDQNPEETSRKDAIQRAFSGSRAEIGENDLRAYIGGSDSEDESEEEEAADPEAENEGDAPKLSKKELARQKQRALLGLADEPTKSSKKSSGPIGDMEVTFTAGLSSSNNASGSVFANEPIKEETTAEKYVRLERERKARRKERSKAKREGRDPDAVAADGEGAEEPAEDLGFDDPFFATDETVKEKAKKSLHKEDRLKKREAKAAAATASAAEKAKLELLMQKDADDEALMGGVTDHFDINEIARAEKKAKKGKKYKKDKNEVEGGKRGGLQKSFEMDVKDPRFGALFESHEFAIDPSNPKFKGTEGMKKLLEEGRKKRRVEGDGEVEVDRKKMRKV